MKTNQIEKKRSIDVTCSDNTATNSQALKTLLSEQLKNVKRQKEEVFYQFKSKQAINYNMNESLSKLKHQGLHPSGTIFIVGDSIINGVIKERINKDLGLLQHLRSCSSPKFVSEIGLLNYAIFTKLQWQIWNIILFQ